MDQINTVRNDALVSAYQNLHKENTPEKQNAVTRQMVRATFLLPVMPVKGKEEDEFPPKVLKNNKGGFFLPLFTDMEQAKKAMPGLSEHMICVDISDAYAYLVDAPNLQGAIINPFSVPNLTCARPMVENLAKLWSRMKTAEMEGRDPEEALRPQPQNLKLSVPKVYPEGAVSTLIAGLKEHPDIRNAWMCFMQKTPDAPQESCDWMVILDAEKSLKGREAAFQALGKALSPHVGKRNILFIEVNESLKPLTKQVPPVYKRETVAP